jgi:hypothetical protein
MTERMNPLSLHDRGHYVCNLSPTTRAVYVHNVEKLSQHGRPRGHSYVQLHFVSQGIAWATLSQVVSSRFFFGIMPSSTRCGSASRVHPAKRLLAGRCFEDANIS